MSIGKASPTGFCVLNLFWQTNPFTIYDSQVHRVASFASRSSRLSGGRTDGSAS
jgi:hypothetical protein